MSKPYPSRADRAVVPRSLAVLAMTSVALLTAMTGVVQAKLTGPAGALKGCVDKHGVLHVVAFGAHCPHGEQAIVFGAQGAAGPAGTTGPQGPAGGEASLTALKTEVSALQSQNATLTSKASALEAKVGALEATLAGVKRSGHTLEFSGMNVQIDSGSGATAGRSTASGTSSSATTSTAANRAARTTS